MNNVIKWRTGCLIYGDYKKYMNNYVEWSRKINQMRSREPYVRYTHKGQTVDGWTSSESNLKWITRNINPYNLYVLANDYLLSSIPLSITVNNKWVLIKYSLSDPSSMSDRKMYMFCFIYYTLLSLRYTTMYIILYKDMTVLAWEHDRKYVRNDLRSYGGEVAPASAMLIPTRWDLTDPITWKYRDVQ